MNKELKLGIFAGVVAIVSLLAGIGISSVFGDSSVPQATENIEEVLEESFGAVLDPVTNQPIFKKGIRLAPNGEEGIEYGYFTIANNDNANEWVNRTGRTVYIPHSEIRVIAQGSGSKSAPSGTASTTANGINSNRWLYAATSTPGTDLASGDSAYARPTGKPFLAIDGLGIGNNVDLASWIGTGTTTSVTGSATTTYSMLPVRNGETFTVQLVTPCVTQGACETATSTNDGLGRLHVSFPYHYLNP